MANEQVVVAANPPEDAGSQNNPTTLDALGPNMAAVINQEETPAQGTQGTNDNTATPTEPVTPVAPVIPQALPVKVSDAVAQTVIDPSQVQAASTEPTTEPSAVDDGAMERMRQDLAAKQKILDGLGIDADKQEYLKNGLYDLNDIVAGLTAHSQNIQPAATPLIPVTPAQPTEAQIPLSQRLGNLKTAVTAQTGDVSPELYKSQMSEALGVIEGLATELDSQKKDNEQVRADNQQAELVTWQKGNMALVHSAVEKADFYAGLPPETQAHVKSLVMGSVNEGVSALANNSDATVRAKALSPQAFTMIAQQTIKQFAQLLGTTHQTGVTAAVNNIQNNPKTVSPISAGTGTNVVQEPQMNMTLESLDANTKTYLQTVQPQV